MSSFGHFGGQSDPTKTEASGGSGGPKFVHTKTPPVRLYSLTDAHLDQIENSGSGRFGNALWTAIGAFLGAAPNGYRALVYFVKPAGTVPDVSDRLSLLIALVALVVFIVSASVLNGRRDQNPIAEIRNRKAGR